MTTPFIANFNVYKNVSESDLKGLIFSPQEFLNIYTVCKDIYG